ncbi:MAG: SRPBCC family protein [Burkholderiales bacterium]
MQVTLDKTYPIAAAPDACWKILSDIPNMASCMPGAEITEKIDGQNYKGTVKVKVGPATAAFGGDIQVLEINPQQRTIKMLGKGADKSGSTASMELTASLVAADDGTTNLVGKSDVIVNGKFAQFGGRMMNSVSDMILAQFASNFAIKAQAIAPADTQVAGSATPSASQSGAPAPVTELNAFKILWMLITNFFKGIFGKQS